MITYQALERSCYEISNTVVSRAPKKRLPTMYELPSEDPEEPGLPDDFHHHQPELLRETFRPYPIEEQFYVASDLNLYYDESHPQWYKRPDWFVVLGAPPLHKNHDLRYSYVVWDEPAKPFMVVELLSEGTEKEDLGIISSPKEEDLGPPTKWQVYEKILRVPYYVVFDRDLNKFHAFQLGGRRYRKIELKEERLWFLEINLGLGFWNGPYQEVERKWLRWYGSDGKWIPTNAEKAEQEKRRADHEKQRAEQLLAQLRALGVEPNV